MPADRVQLVRHGEVHNPDRVLYGRLPNFRLSETGRRMAREAADYVVSLGRPVTVVECSPLQRTRESAEPFAELFGLPVEIDDRLIEPANVFEGKRMRRALANPANWRHLARPEIPSWGEPYRQIAARMDGAVTDAWRRADGGDVVLVSHQLPIWTFHLAVAQEPFRHDPRRRRCALSSVTTFERRGDRWAETGYAEPAQQGAAIDVGAV